VGVYPDTRVAVIWEDRLAPLSLSGIDKWWARTLRTAGVEHFPMHELRHSAGTNFWRVTRDVLMTQKMMRHEKMSTTFETYVHDDSTDLADAMSRLPAWEVEG
jgi:integrase